ncbi:UDP-N-acetyl-D-mannosaminuronic acid transferase [Weizmannia acidilactici]|uniref:UDP-N-acetyl-D-mannosaminuronic acid transferase n=1 Tax=Weizmannia acidilactici TaxID=2607726 RepID=A0A5J4JQP5_9BACI|nr:WecB/TagA/CpsF family glycosyltransferase [Weizmannia acidilactici]GER67133.1 UDP-N-acetyl-D-mannosaminuronic acid transferase [Weizmannia acidilactici]GER71414.1 UDP-N-acetyl-D-mannosaminuronic acid transferase [Weizmannia acidilactici]GER74750.1 UDP-N-acetyl-D-mannosaminuronic acid transferase [Weizmannia acidilactici]
MKKAFGNIDLTVITEEQFLDEFVSRIRNGKKTNIYFLNAHCYNVAQTDAYYHRILNEADYLLNDGVGVEIGAKLFDIPLSGNLNGTDLTPKILKRCEENGFSVFVLGSNETNLQSAIRNFRRDYPGLKIAGAHHGYFQSKKEMAARINNSGADVLIVGMGVPLQEKFIADFDKELACLARIGVGAFIDFASENVPRAPYLFRKLRIEWLFRLMREPKRLWKRNVGSLVFLYRIFMYKWMH